MRKRLGYLVAFLALIWAAPTWAALGTPTDIGSTSAAAGSATLVLTTTATVTAGDLSVVYVGISSANNISGVTDSAGNTYICGTQYNGTGARLRFCWSITTSTLASGGTITATYDVTGGTKWVLAAKQSGVVSADQSGTGAQASSTAPSITTGTLGATNETVYVGLSISSIAGATFTEDGTFTGINNVLSGSFNRYLSYKTVASNSAVTYTSAISAARQWNVQYETFSGDVSAGGKRTLLGVGQ